MTWMLLHYCTESTICKRWALADYFPTMCKILLYLTAAKCSGLILNSVTWLRASLYYSVLLTKPWIHLRSVVVGISSGPDRNITSVTWKKGSASCCNGATRSCQKHMDRYRLWWLKTGGYCLLPELLLAEPCQCRQGLISPSCAPRARL